MEKRRIFYGCSILGFAVSLFLIIMTDGEALKPFFYYYKDYNMDFFNHILYVRDRLHVYEASVFATFPPLAYILYYFLGKFIPPSAVPELHGRALRDNLFGFNLYVIYTLILVVIFIFLVQCCLEREKKIEQLGFSLLVLLSAPFIGLYERGNSSFIVLLLLMGFILLKDSPTVWKRETALLLLAVAAALKLYPAVFGLLYLQERRWKEAVRLTIYGIFLVFFPFVFFGGFQKIPVLMYNFQFISEVFIERGDLRSVAYVVVLIGQKLGFEIPSLIALGQKISYVFFALSCLCVLLQSSLWKRITLLCGIMIFFPTWSGSYTLIYLVLPLLLYFGDVPGKEMKKKQNILGFLYPFLFACVFTMMLWNPAWSDRLFHSEFSYTLRILGAWGLVLGIMAETLWAAVRNLRKKQSAVR